MASFSSTTATGLSRALGGGISHDKITRFWSEEDFTSKHRWSLVKPTIGRIQSADGIIIFDDIIEEKPSTKKPCFTRNVTLNL